MNEIDWYLYFSCLGLGDLLQFRAALSGIGAWANHEEHDQQAGIASYARKKLSDGACHPPRTSAERREIAV